MLRRYISEGQFVMAAGVFDCVSARVAETTGFEALYVTGHGVSNSALGLSDIGLMTFTELSERAAAITASVKTPVIVDCDTGYGGPLNVQRTVREMERIGAAAIQLEDQMWPKKCGHMPGKQLISAAEMCSKLNAADDARETEMVIIARTDALAVEGLESAIARSKQYFEAGADVVFIDAIGDVDEIRSALNELKMPVMVNMVEGSRTHYESAQELEKFGFSVGIWPITLLLTAITSMQAAARELREHGRLQEGTMEKTMSFPEFLDFWSFDEIVELEANYSVPR